MLQISAQQLEETLGFPQLINSLKAAFCESWVTPPRHHHDVINPKASESSTLLLMPAWSAGEYLGVKTIIVAPQNYKYQLPAIQGTYTLFDANKGLPLAQIDAPKLTALRTAAASALASSFLSRKDSQSLLMVGTGALAIPLIKAHASVRPLQTVYVWGRNFAKAKNIKSKLSGERFEVQAIKNISDATSEAAIISCATLSPDPLILGEQLQAGQHIDLVGSYRPHMREADDETIRRCRLFVDTLENATKESGDLVIPLREKVMTLQDINADLFQLCRKEKKGRLTNKEITLFKSVGHALEDLAAAKLVYENIVK